MTQGVQQAQDSLNTLGTSVQKSQAQLTGLTGSILQTAAAFVSLRAGIHAIESLVQAGSQIETLKAGLNTLAGSIEAGARAYDFAAAQANKLGFEVVGLVGNYKTLVATTRETFLAGAQTDKMFLQLSNTARALSLNAGQTNSLFQVFEGALARGTIQSNQLVRGLQGIPGGLNLVARAIGVTVDQLRIMGQEQDLLSGVVVPRVLQLLQQEIGSKAEAAANTVEAATNRMKNAWKSLGEVLVNTGAPTAFIQSLEVAVKYWEQILRTAQQYSVLQLVQGAASVATGGGIPPPGDPHAVGVLTAQGFKTPAGQPNIDETGPGKAYAATLAQLNKAQQAAEREAQAVQDIQHNLATHKIDVGVAAQAFEAATAALAKAEAQVVSLQKQLDMDFAAVQKVYDFLNKVGQKQTELAAVQSKQDAATTAEANRYQNAINLQAELNRKLQEARDLIAQTEEQIRQEPSTREEATKELVRQLDKIQKTLDFTRALNKDLLTLQPGPTTLVAPTGLNATQAARYAAAVPFIQSASAQYGVDPLLETALLKQESGFNPNAIGPQTRFGRAQGIGQLLPGTARDLGVTQPYDLAQGVSGSVRYLAQMLEKFSGNIDLALAAYNAGPGAVQKYGGMPPYPETQNYVQVITATYAQLQASARTGNLQGPTLEGTPFGTPVTAPLSLQGPTLSGAPLGGQPVLDATRAGVDANRIALDQLKLQVLQFANETKDIKLFTDLRTELAKITQLPDVFAANELERLNQISATTQRLKLEFAKAPEATSIALKAAILDMKEQVDQAFATFTLKQISLKLEKEVDDLIGNLNIRAAQFRQQLPASSLALQNPGAAQTLGLNHAELTGPAVPQFATTPRIQEASQMLVKLAQAEATGIDPAKILAASDAINKMFTDEGLAAGATFLQQLQDQYDLIVKLPAALQAEKLAREGVSQAQIAQAESLRQANIAAKGAASISDLLLKTFEDLATGARVSALQIGEAFAKLLLQIAIDASGVKQELSGLFTTALKSIAGALGLGGAGGGAGAGVSAGSAAGLEGEGALFASGLAEGGPMLPGQARLVGERGAELFTPNQAGTITSHEALQGLRPIQVVFNVITNNPTEFVRSQNEIQGKALRFFQQAQRAS